jgi:glyoxylase-like metal-dependent hydrolase (beta-lactamase superfamily II)
MNYNRRKFMHQGALGLASFYLASCSKKINYGLMEVKEKSYSIKHLRNRVGYFKEKGGTIAWMIDGKDTVIVDTEFPAQASNLQQEMLKLTDDTVNIIFNTHHHGDHTSGNIQFKGLVSQVIAHKNSAINQKLTAEKMKSIDNNLFPNFTFDDKGYKTKVGRENISCHYFGPAHTNGDSIIHFEDSNVIHVGDLMFNRRFPYIDKQGGAMISNWVQVLDKINTTFDNDTIIIAGHAAETHDVLVSKEDLNAFKNYLEKLLTFGEQCIKQGLTKEEVIANNKIIPGAIEWTGDGINRSIEAVYIELTN